MLSDISPEQRAEMQRKAAAKREEDKKFAAQNLRNDFSDKLQWRRLASAYKVRLPSWYVRNTRSIRRAAKTLGFDGCWVTDQTGHASLRELMESNPTWPSYAFIGLMLESAHERDGGKDLGEDIPPEDDAEEEYDDLI